MENIIQDESSEQAVTEDERERLQDEGIIYPCNECNSYHIMPGYSWNSVDTFTNRGNENVKD